MKNRSQIIYGLRTVFTPGKDGAIESVSTRNKVYDDNLIVSNGLVQGNFHSPNAFKFDKQLLGQLEGTMLQEFPKGKFKQMIVGPLGYSVTAPLGDNGIDNLYNEVLSSMNDKIRSSVDWTTNAAQASQTASMVKKSIETLRYVRKSAAKLDLWGAYLAYKRMRRDPPRTLTRGVKALGNRWLEFQYGWKPLAQDLYDTAVELGRDFPSLMVIEAKAQRRVARTTNTNLFGCPRVQTSYRSDRLLMKCRFKPNTSTVNLLSNFTTLNPATVAWELTPYSFVVDWFVDVGGYMRNLETSLLAGGGFQDGFMTSSSLSQLFDSVGGSYQYPGADYFVISASGSSRISSLNRSKMGAWPLPRVPTFKADLGSGRLLNSAALLSQELKVRR